MQGLEPGIEVFDPPNGGENRKKKAKPHQPGCPSLHDGDDYRPTRQGGNQGERVPLRSRPKDKLPAVQQTSTKRTMRCGGYGGPATGRGPEPRPPSSIAARHTAAD